MKRLLENPKFVFLLVLPTFLIGIYLGSFGYSKVIRKSPTRNAVATNFPLPEIIEGKIETSKNAKLLNILLTGHGGNGHSGGGLMDAIILVSVNFTDKKANIVSIPRDLWFSGHKINADPSLKDAVAGITGLSVPYQISIDFSQFIKMINSLNGITVDVKKAYTDNFYPVKGLENELCGISPEKVAELHLKYSGFELEKQFTCRYETISYNTGINHMDGKTALKYVRSRHGGSDFERSRHQYEVLKAILQKGDIKKIADVFDFVNTSLDLEEINLLLTNIGNPLEYAINYIGINDSNVLVSSKSPAGAFILVEKEEQGVSKYILSVI